MNTIIVIITGTSSQNGLLKLITRTTQFDNSHIVCTKGFSLMMTLLDISLNRYANDFMDVFKRLRVKDLNTLDFESHIEHGKMNGCKEKSFELLNLYMKQNPTISPEEMFTNNSLFNQYISWKNNKQFMSKALYN